jgi:hypothetical protein
MDMSYEAHRRGSREDNAKADLKPIYEAPKIIPLGELAVGWGAPCVVGSRATGNCEDGASYRPPQCFSGSWPMTGSCRDGGDPSAACNAGGVK